MGAVGATDSPHRRALKDGETRQCRFAMTGGRELGSPRAPVRLGAEQPAAGA